MKIAPLKTIHIGAMLVLALAVLVSGRVQAGQQTGQSAAAAAAPAKNSATLVSPDEDYRIGVGDVIDVTVTDAPELTKSFRVTAAGSFMMSFVGRVEAKNKTPEQLATYIADKLRGDYLKNPQVLVVVKEYNSRTYFIQGAVRSPGVFQIEGKPSLLTLITMAGGLEKDHGTSAFVIRRALPPPPTPAQLQVSTQADAAASADDDTEYELIKININSLLKGNFSNNAALQPGDIVNVPVADVFYVAGEVNAPGSFPLKEGTTLRQAISMAQGNKLEAALGRGVIFRDDANGKREEIKVDIGEIMKGKKDDVVILANDIIIVPNSRAKTIGGALLRGLGMSTMNRGIPIR